MVKLIRPAVGAFVRVPLGGGWFGYARSVEFSNLAFYDYRTEGPSDDLDTIEGQKLIFTISVRVFATDGWEQIGKRPLAGAVAAPIVKFMQNIADPSKCVIADSTGAERQVGPDECVGIERAAVWDSRHVVERLNDHFAGRPNRFEIEQRPRPVQ